MNVYAKRRILAAELTRVLRHEFVVVANPDHPFLLRAADVIIGGDARLAVIFLPSAMETKRPEELRARLILNRLALPSSTKTVLLFEKSQSPLAEIFFEDFDMVIPWQNREAASSVFAEDATRILPPEVKMLVDKRFAMAATVTSLMRRIDREPERKSLFRNRAHKSVDRIGQTDIAIFSGGRFDATLASEMINSRINDQAKLDRGVPYFNQVTPAIALVGDWPIYPSDPDKILRASAFAGWSIMNQDQSERVGQVDEFIRRRFK